MAGGPVPARNDTPQSIEKAGERVARKEKTAKKGKASKQKKPSRAERKAAKQEQKKKKSGSLLLSLLTMLLILVGIAELGLLSFIGITAFRSSFIKPQDISVTPGQSGTETFYIQYSGPGRRVVDGVLVEGRELEQNMVQTPADNPSAT